MTAISSVSAETPPSPRAGRRPATVVSATVLTWSDALLDAAVWVLASWTIAYHAALIMNLAWYFAVGLFAVGLLGGAVARRWRARPLPTSRFEPVAVGRDHQTVLIGCVVVLIVAVGLSGSAWSSTLPEWWLFWFLIVTALTVVSTLVLVGRPVVQSSRTIHQDPGRGALGVVALAAIVGTGSAVVQRPDADDVFLINRSVYIAERGGTFPVRDTLFSDEVFRITRPDFPSTAIEPLIGVAARVTHLPAATLTYLVLGPIAAALSVLALWRLLRTLGALAPALATLAGLIFLLLDGADHAGFGNLSFVRSWQGKVIFLIVLLPSIAHFALRWARDNSAADLILLIAANIASIGLTSTAVFVAPATTLVVIAAGAMSARSPRPLLVGLLALVPAFVVAITRLVSSPQSLAGGQPALATQLPGILDFTPEIEPSSTWHFVFGYGWRLVLPVGAAVFAWAFVSDRTSRVALALAPLMLFGVFLGPGMLDILDELSGARSILWRTIWILPIPAAVGLAATAPLLIARRGLRRTLSVLVPALMVVSMFTLNDWVLAGSNQQTSIGGVRWDVDRESLAASREILRLAPEGATVLAPVSVSGALAISTTQVRTVNPRDRYLYALAKEPDFFSVERRLLDDVIDGASDKALTDSFVDALARLEVSVVCTRTDGESGDLAEALGRSGFDRVGSDSVCTYWLEK